MSSNSQQSFSQSVRKAEIQLCIHYDTTGWPRFKPVCKLGYHASLKCHAKHFDHPCGRYASEEVNLQDLQT